MKKLNQKLVMIFLVIALLVMNGCSAQPEAESLPDSIEVTTEDTDQEQSESDDHTAQALTLEVTIPAQEQLTIAPARDFYVIGTIDGEISADTKLTVSLYKSGETEPVRQVYTQTKDDKDNLYIDYDLLSYYAGDDRSPLKDSLMPDLVYDASDVETFKDAWRKCYYDDQNFTAVFAGGKYSTDINLVDEDGNVYEELEAGDYTIKVTAEDVSGNLLAETDYDFTIGVTADKVLSRFSPANHFEKVQDEAEANDYTIYIDPFPGYWSPSSFIESLEDSSLFAEILPKWRLADATEYQGGRTHFYIYNVSQTSATYAVELGTLQYQQVIDDPDRMLYYYYDIGEPELTNDSIEGNFVQFDHGDRLQLTRSDDAADGSKDNYLDLTTLADTTSDTDFSDGITGYAGKTISIYGVVTPIQNTAQEVTANEDNTYTISNNIAAVQYTISGDGVDYTTAKEVGLTRLINDYTYFSVFEFKHDLQLEESWSGKTLTVSVQAYDVNGVEVEGTYEEFELQVEEAQEMPNAA